MWDKNSIKYVVIWYNVLSNEILQDTISLKPAAKDTYHGELEQDMEVSKFKIVPPFCRDPGTTTAYVSIIPRLKNTLVRQRGFAK